MCHCLIYHLKNKQCSIELVLTGTDQLTMPTIDAAARSTSGPPGNEDENVLNSCGFSNYIRKYSQSIVIERKYIVNAPIIMTTHNKWLDCRLVGCSYCNTNGQPDQTNYLHVDTIMKRRKPICCLLFIWFIFNCRD